SRYPGHTVGQARSTSVKPTFCVGPALARVYSFFMDAGARREHELLVGNAKMGVFFPLVVEYRRPFVLRKVRTYLRKSHFPTESFIAHTADLSAWEGYRLSIGRSIGGAPINCAPTGYYRCCLLKFIIG